MSDISQAEKPAFILTACDGVTIEKDRFDGLKDPVIKLSGMNKKNIRTNLKSIIFQP